MFKFSKIDFDIDSIIDTAIDDINFEQPDAVDFFDKDGYELTKLEQTYYQTQGLPVIKYTANHPGLFQPWITVEHDNLSIDHSCAMLRCAFDGLARQQITKHQHRNPRFGWLLTCKPKWGLDLNIDYCSSDFALEVIHLEIDSNTVDNITDSRDRIEDFVKDTDWIDAAHRVWQLRDQWQHLTGWYAQAHWKAKYFGFERPWY